MYRLCSHITIGKTEFNFVCDVAIKESIETLTDTCIIKLPKKLKWNDSEIFFGPKALIRRRDKVEVRLGYNDELHLVFKGYVRSIHRKIPVEIECEDEMYRLKWPENIIDKKVFSSVTLTDLLSYVLPPGINYTCAQMNLGRYVIKDNVEPVKVLEQLADKSSYGLSVYFQLINNEPMLFVGLPHLHFSEQRKVHKFRFQYNIIQDNLTYTEKEDRKIKIKAISIMPNNLRHEVEVAPTDGGLRTFNYYNIDKASLKKQADEMLSELQIDGYDGTLTAFGLPFVRKADAVKLYDDRFVNTEEVYSVKAVNRTFGTGGYRQQITIDRRIS